MKVFVLLIYLFGGQGLFYSEAVTVSTPQNAALVLYQRQHSFTIAPLVVASCPDCQGALYEVTLPGGSWVPVAIPEVSFTAPAEARALTGLVNLQNQE